MRREWQSKQASNERARSPCLQGSAVTEPLPPHPSTMMMITYAEPPCIFLTCVPVCTNTPPPLPLPLPALHFLLFLVRYPPSPSSSVGSSIERASACGVAGSYERGGGALATQAATAPPFADGRQRAGERGRQTAEGEGDIAPSSSWRRAHLCLTARAPTPRSVDLRARQARWDLCLGVVVAGVVSVSGERRASERPEILRSSRLSSERARGVF